MGTSTNICTLPIYIGTYNEVQADSKLVPVQRHHPEVQGIVLRRNAAGYQLVIFWVIMQLDMQCINIQEALTLTPDTCILVSYRSHNIGLDILHFEVAKAKRLCRS